MSENRFESVVELTAALTGAPVCLLTKIEEGQAEFLARKGITLDQAATDGSFCGVTVENPGSVLHVPDARQDPRFSGDDAPVLYFDDQPLISYIGVPVVDQQGLPVGTVCALDTVPRAYTKDVTRSLERLADYASSLMGGESPGDRPADFDINIDDLTGLSTRAALVGDAYVSKGRRDMVAVADLTGMTGINADLGRAHGDRILQEAAESLRQAMPETAQVARIGGDAFAVVGSAHTGWEHLTREMLATIKGPFSTPDGGKIQLGAVVGVAISEGPDELMEGLIGRAESAVKLAKLKGPGAVVLSSESCTAVDSRQAHIRNFLHDSLSRDELTVAYQAITDLNTGSVIGTEALCRWKHPELGVVAPNEFIPMMEEAGLIRGLTDHVLTTALQDFADGQLPGTNVSVNVSPTEIDSELPARIQAALEATGTKPNDLILEVTEQINDLNREDMIGSLRQIADMGVSLAIDDFGAGSTSVAQLRSLPVSRLKLDRSLVQDLGGEDSSRADIVIRSIVGIADGLGLELVAEGVETAVQADLLREALVTMAQGFFFSRPEWITEFGLPIKVAAEAESLASSFFDRTRDMAFVSKSNRVIRWNRHFQERLGWSDDEIKGSTLADIFHPADSSTIRKALLDPESDASWSAEARLRTREGTFIDTLLSISSDAGAGLKVVAAADIGQLKKLEENRTQLNETLSAIAELQDEYIERGLSRAWWEKALARVVEVSECGFGFVGRITADENGEKILHSYALSNIAWNDWSRSVFDDYFEGGLQFKDPDTLYGATVTKGETVLTNDAPHDHRAGGTPEGHPTLRNYAGIPLVYEDEVIGMVGLANRPQGMDERLVEILEPLTSHLAKIVQLDLKVREAGIMPADSNGTGAERSTLPKVHEIGRATARAMPAVLASYSAAAASVVIRETVTELVPNAIVAFQDVEGDPLPDTGDPLIGVSSLSCQALATGIPTISKPGLQIETCGHANPRCYATICVPVVGGQEQIGLISVEIPSAVDLSPEQPVTVAESLLQMLVTLASGLAVKLPEDFLTETA